MTKAYRNIQNSTLRTRARQLRQEPTAAEHVLWQRLRNRGVGGLKFRRQVPFGNYIVDFYCSAARIVVEVDGSMHAEQAEYDATRTVWLENNGLRVLRFRNEDVLQRLEAVLDAIERAAGPHP